MTSVKSDTCFLWLLGVVIAFQLQLIHITPFYPFCACSGIAQFSLSYCCLWPWQRPYNIWCLEINVIRLCSLCLNDMLLHSSMFFEATSRLCPNIPGYRSTSTVCLPPCFALNIWRWAQQQSRLYPRIIIVGLTHYLLVQHSSRDLQLEPCSCNPVLLEKTTWKLVPVAEKNCLTIFDLHWDGLPASACVIMAFLQKRSLQGQCCFFHFLAAAVACPPGR